MNAQDTSKIVTLEYEKVYCCHALIITVYIDAYSDSLKTYEYEIGRVKSVLDLQENITNIIYIKLPESWPNSEDVFDYIIN